MVSRSLLQVLVFGFVVCVLSTGCGSSTPAKKEVKGAKVNGTLLQNGKPIVFLKDETIKISFSMGAGDAQVASVADVKAEGGTFTIDGPTNQGIPAGKYKIQVVGDVYGANVPNRFEAIFSGATRRELTVDVTEAEGQQFEIDISKWTVKKK